MKKQQTLSRRIRTAPRCQWFNLDWILSFFVSLDDQIARISLVAATKKISLAIWNPNPQLNNFDLGEVSIYHWKDTAGRDLQGDLYKPSNYHPGQRYPLVLPPHGNYKSKFKPSGEFTTAFAAQEMAANGLALYKAP